MAATVQPSRAEREDTEQALREHFGDRGARYLQHLRCRSEDPVLAKVIFDMEQEALREAAARRRRRR